MLRKRLASTKQLVEKRFLRLERALPILVDFAEDRVYFPWSQYRSLYIGSFIYYSCRPFYCLSAISARAG
jgi:hypothetical protein